MLHEYREGDGMVFDAAPNALSGGGCGWMFRAHDLAVVAPSVSPHIRIYCPLIPRVALHYKVEGVAREPVV